MFNLKVTNSQFKRVKAILKKANMVLTKTAQYKYVDVRDLQNDIDTLKDLNDYILEVARRMDNIIEDRLRAQFQDHMLELSYSIGNVSIRFETKLEEIVKRKEASKEILI